ncbi:TadE/TadG family type IV pilus assembly protein [Streptomyces sp. DT24]|uniref:TadE/TadG family type IV pilus assembly protein n=1 Tax=unclassified Streptomyces TaxID=2593676 RepID=UPI0023B8C11A|nr:TadE/TadG family type IV pilus assembly protein [Streptomyces sp. AM 4-1-1]WEH35605.1 pilus assembly protein [Streptomyces sp. AM 4-1-1]
MRTRRRAALRRPDTDGARGGRARGDRGQVIVEFTGMVPIILLTLALLWQMVLLGYTYTLAGSAADAGVHAAAVKGAGACAEAVADRLPGAWEGGAVDCGGGDSDMVRVTVTLKAPILFPGFADLPIPVRGVAGAAREDR